MKITFDLHRQEYFTLKPIEISKISKLSQINKKTKVSITTKGSPSIFTSNVKRI